MKSKVVDHEAALDALSCALDRERLGEAPVIQMIQRQPGSWYTYDAAGVWIAVGDTPTDCLRALKDLAVEVWGETPTMVRSAGTNDTSRTYCMQ